MAASLGNRIGEKKKKKKKKASLKLTDIYNDAFYRFEGYTTYIFQDTNVDYWYNFVKIVKISRTIVSLKTC